MTPRLPISIDPYPDESIASMLRRLSTATGIPVHNLHPCGVSGRLTDRQMGALARTLGLPPRRLRTHTLHHRLAGRHSRRPASIELRRTDRIICSACGIGSLWSGLVWVSHCPSCQALLNEGVTVDRAVHALEMQDAFLRSMRAPNLGFADRRLRLLRLLRLHVHLATVHAATGAQLAGSWQAPAWIAGFAEHAWPASRTVQATRDLIGERTSTHLGETPAPEDDCAAVRQALHDQLRGSEITEAEIPDFLHPRHRALDVDAAGEDLGHGIARALRREAIHAATGARPTVAQLDERYGDLRKRPMTATCVQHLGNTSAGLRILAREADRLAHAGIRDYRYRRAVLMTLHSVPISALALTAVPRTPRDQRLAAAWIWLELTQGTLGLTPTTPGCDGNCAHSIKRSSGRIGSSSSSTATSSSAPSPPTSLVTPNRRSHGQRDMPMLAYLTPLPVTIAPVAGEALDGYLERLGAANALPHPVLVQRLSEAGAPTAFLSVAPAERLIANLAALTGLDPVALRCCTLASMVGIDTDGLDPANKNSWRRAAARGWPPVHGTALCPRCLDDDGIWQLSWRHPWVTTCTQHRLWLIDHCPTCGRRLRSHRTPLRAVDTSPDRCGNPDGARGRGCQQPLGELDTIPAPAAVLVAQRRIDSALQGRPGGVLGDLMEPSDYLRELKSLTVLLLHLAVQPGGEDLAPWAETARADSERSAGAGGVRWGLAPPANLQLRGQAIAAADEILRAASLDDAADELHPWTELTPATNDGQLGWLADHTTMTPLLTRLVMVATSSRRRLATLLDSSGILLPLTAVPQVVPADLYTRHTAAMLDVTARTGRLFVALCLARQHLRNLTWAQAASALGLPPELGSKTARACSADLLAPGGDFIAALTRVANELDPAVDYRARENAVRRLLRRRGWYRPWARIHLPGSHATSQQYAVTWLWTEYAHGHVDTSPGWQHPPDRQDRAHYRAYAGRLDEAATDALTELVANIAAANRRSA